MKYSKLFMIVTVFVVGCASSPSKNKTSSIIQALPALPANNYASVSLYGRVTPEDCPSSDVSWRKESLKNLIQYSNACFVLKKTSRLEVLANFIAQKYHETPWGPYYLSLAYQLKSEYSLALWMVELSIKKSPKTALLHYQKARIYWEMKEFSHAIEAYNQAIKENPRFVEAHMFLAELYFHEQNFKLAEKHFLAVTDVREDSGPATAGLAECRLMQNNSRTGIELYEKAVNLTPRNVQYRLRLARLYEEVQKDPVLALSMYKKIKELGANSSLKIDINEKIKNLEQIVSREVSSEKKVTKVENKKPGVKK